MIFAIKTEIISYLEKDVWSDDYSKTMILGTELKHLQSI